MSQEDIGLGAPADLLYPTHSQDRACSTGPAWKLSSFRVATLNSGCKDKDVCEALCCEKKSPKVLRELVKSVFKIDQGMCYHFSAVFFCSFSYLVHGLDFC